MFSDPSAILLGIVLLVVLLAIGTHFFPDDVHLDPWRYQEPSSRAGGGQGDDDPRFHWERDEPKAPPERDR